MLSKFLVKRSEANRHIKKELIPNCIVAKKAITKIKGRNINSYGLYDVL